MVALHPGHGAKTKRVEQRVHNRLCVDKTFLVFPVPHTETAFSFLFNPLPAFKSNQLDLFSSLCHIAYDLHKRKRWTLPSL